MKKGDAFSGKVCYARAGREWDWGSCPPVRRTDDSEEEKECQFVMNAEQV